MRLKKLKLVGFKSFVDSTTVLFPSNLVAVVGPNGCGKSNIIDAVRWVMGESSAKNLRGESMADVIFNGSSNRKPVGQGSVELVFENSLGRLLGEYASFNEISIKRLVSRDGQSSYFLNGSKCRKKDITDIFLGTGLGPRSYSIIGQGTISRIIEAKPEELRIFLEEAAGISKYKERRRETENRIKQTRENLERVLDIREELAKQLERLQRQANAAKKYKTLRADEKMLKAQLHALRFQALDRELAEKDQCILAANNELLAVETKQQHIDSELECLREQLNVSNEQYHAVQAEYYQVGADIARIEEAIASQKKREQQLNNDLNQSRADFSSAESHRADMSLQLTAKTDTLATLTPELSTLKKAYDNASLCLSRLEEKRANWQSAWDEFNQAAAESSKVAHIEQLRIQQLEQSVQKAHVSLEKIHAERANIDMDSVDVLTDKLLATSAECQAQNDALDAQLTEVTALLEIKDAMKCRQEKEVATKRHDWQQLAAKVASLDALQQAALGKNDKQLTLWLNEQGLDSCPRLAEQVTVLPGWERAVEVVLASWLQSLCVSSLPVDGLATLNQGSISFVDDRQTPQALVTTAKRALYQQINSDNAVAVNALSGIYAADNLDEALLWLPEIAFNESIVTKDGLWLGHGYLRFSNPCDLHQGVLERERELTTSSAAAAQLKNELMQLVTLFEQTTAEVVHLQQQKETLREQLTASHRMLADVDAQRKVTLGKKHQCVKHLETLDEAEQEQLLTLETTDGELLSARDAWQAAMQVMAEDGSKRDELMQQKGDVAGEITKAQQSVSEARERLHQKELVLKTTESEQRNLKESLARETKRCEQMSQRILQLEQELLGSEPTPGEDSNAQQLEAKLSLHLQLKTSLDDAKNNCETVKQSQLELEHLRQQADNNQRTQSALLETLRIDAENLRVRAATVKEAIAEGEHDLQYLIETMPEGASESAWDEQLQSVLIGIQRLGAINLAAIEEYDASKERKRYLDEQFDDLTEALTTLESAIRKIDKETRARFKETYSQVNEGFTQLFPRLFGGGRAYLELTGDDLLDTGVTVMAQPPGKRNSTIHLLSGGEKAMAAVALVFAIFQLNPSPFCMLDEVDAPLDDSNVNRFCSMVKEMSHQVQFIFITHNKVTMELATHLSGVTMHEPGVSRIVSVDVEQAMTLVE